MGDDANPSGMAWPDTACRSPKDRYILPDAKEYPFFCENHGQQASILVLRGCDHKRLQKDPQKVVLYAPGTHGWDTNDKDTSAGTKKPSGQQKSKVLMEQLANRGISTVVVDFANTKDGDAKTLDCRNPNAPDGSGGCLYTYDKEHNACLNKGPCGYDLDILRSLDYAEKKFPNAEFVLLGHSMGAKAVSNLTSKVNNDKRIIERR